MKRMYYTMGAKKFFSWILFGLFLVFFYGPLIYMFVIAFAGDYNFPDIIPQTFSLKWWEYVFSTGNFLELMITSLVLATVVTLVSLIVCLPAAYAIARFDFKGKSLARSSFLITNAFPKMGIYTAMAVLFYRLNLIGTFTGVVLVHILNTMLFMVWIPAGSFRNIHREQEEAAKDCGASNIKVFLDVTLPMAKPGIIVASLFTFLSSIEEAEGTLLVGLPNIKTMPMEMYGIIQSYPATAGAVFAILLLIPSLVLIIVFRKYLSAESLSSGFKD